MNKDDIERMREEVGKSLDGSVYELNVILLVQKFTLFLSFFTF